jgi:hypothetical protein
MKISKLVAALFLVAIGTPALAQSVPDDVRCLVLSNIFSRNAKETPGRESAAKSLLFYLGRLDGRADVRTITNAMRALNGKIDPKTAPAEMSACAARIVHAQQTIQAAGRAAASGN